MCLRVRVCVRTSVLCESVPAEAGWQWRPKLWAWEERQHVREAPRSTSDPAVINQALGGGESESVDTSRDADRTGWMKDKKMRQQMGLGATDEQVICFGWGGDRDRFDQVTKQEKCLIMWLVLSRWNALNKTEVQLKRETKKKEKFFA